MTPNSPAFSIVTPSYQQGQFIEATIRSVLDQNYSSLEYTVIDGGSNDQTLDILRKYQSQLTFTSQPDRGQADAINQGFARTRGQILGWLNSDDTLAPGAIRAAADIFSARPDIGVVYGNANFIDAASNPIGPCAHIEPFNMHRLLHYSDYLVQPAVFFRRALFEKVGGLDMNLHWTMDYDLWLKLARVTQFQYIPRVLAHYRWLETSKTGAGGRMRLAEVEQVARRHGARGLPAFFRLEKIRLDLLDALHHARQFQFPRAAANAASAAMALLGSPRAFASACSYKTWRIIWMGQMIRRRAAQHCAAQGKVS